MPISTLPLDHLLASTDHKDFAGRRALSDVSASIAKAKRVVVVSGAGISCSSGIPDFRSEQGLYSLVKSRYPDDFFTGKDLFSSGLFSNPQTTAIFYTFIAELYDSCQAAKPTPTHDFIYKLDKKGKLLRSYTQNVDGLERRMGLESGGRGNGLKKKGTRNVELHGDLGRVRCVLCMKDYEATKEYMDMFREGDAPECPCCSERSESRVSRSARATPIGTLRPAIVLYDEPHPLGDDIGDLQTYDLGRNPDVLLIMGTSLKVHGLKRVVKEFAKVVHNRPKGLVVFVNATPPSKEWEGIIDVHVHGETDTWVRRVEQEWRQLRPADWETQQTLDGDVAILGSAGAVAVKPEIKPKARPASVKPKAVKKERKPKVKKQEITMLPTPPPSQPVSSRSPSLTPLSSDNEESSKPFTLPLSPVKALPTAPPTPISPSKRQNASSSSTDKFGRSPWKKSKSFNDVPVTGFPSSPGGGNLFALRPTNTAVKIELGAEMDVFGSPTKPLLREELRVGQKHCPSLPPPSTSLAKTRRTRSKTTAMDKENIDTTAFAIGRRGYPVPLSEI